MSSAGFFISIDGAWAGFPSSLAWSIALAAGPVSSLLCLLIHHSHPVAMVFLKLRAAHGSPCLSLFDYSSWPLEKVRTI